VTLQELAAETLVQKHIRLTQAKCRHKECGSSSVTSERGTFTQRYCLDCGKTWHSRRN
jgi:hypothetical protein